MLEEAAGGARPLGQSGLRVTRLGLGMAALGRPGYINVGHGQDYEERSVEAMRARAFELLDAAYAAGLRYLDAARSYGRAEEFLKNWLDARRLPAGELIVGSKWGYTYTAGWKVEAAAHEVKDHSLAAFERQLGESQAILGPHLALYQIHSATPESRVLEDGAVLDALARLRDRGIRVGLSVSGSAQAEVIRRALGIARGGAPLFASVQASWNLLERSAEEALSEAHQAGLGVIVKEALANGRLTARGRALGLWPSASALEEATRALGATPDAVALAAALAQPWADVVLLGAATLEQLSSNLGALRLALRREQLEALGALRVDPRTYWAERARLPWT